MSLALYRTYRPGRFADVIGQEHVTVPLTRALTHDRLHHAYLFTGPRGCGKTSSARILARSLNCEEGPTPEPCGRCGSCVDLAPNGPGSLDVIELDAASHGGVDDTRDLRERAMFAPVSSRYKIYIIDEAHMVTTQGFNALLKLIEEPPPHVRFIFATTEADKVLATIRSRTHQYAFRLVPAKVLADHLAHVCDAEGIAYEPAALALVARAGEGSVRDSLSILGQLIGGSSDEGITYADAVTQLGFTSDALLDDVVAAFAAQDAPALFSAVESVVAAGHDPRRFVTDLLERLRDLIVLAGAPDAAHAGLVDAPPDRLEQLQHQASGLGLAGLSRAADLVTAALSELKGATAPRLQLELLAARLLLPAADAGQGGTLARLDRLERSVASMGEGLVLGAGGAPAVHVAATPAPAAAPAPASPPAAPPSSPEARAHAAPAAEAGEPVAPAPPPRLSQVAPTTAGASAEAGPPQRPAASSPAPAPAVDPAPPSAPAEAPSSAAEVAGSGIDLAAVRTMWPGVLEKIKLDSRVAWTMFERSAPLSVSGSTLTVGLPEQTLLARARQRGDDVRLREALLAVLRLDLTPELVLDPSAGAPAAAGGAASPSAPAGTPSGEGPPSASTPSGAAAQAAPDGGPADETPRPSRAAAAMAAAREQGPESDPTDDVASPDDPDVDALSGVDLVARELGGTVVTEYDGD